MEDVIRHDRVQGRRSAIRRYQSIHEHLLDLSGSEASKSGGSIRGQVTRGQDIAARQLDKGLVTRQVLGHIGCARGRLGRVAVRARDDVVDEVLAARHQAWLAAIHGDGVDRGRVDDAGVLSYRVNYGSVCRWRIGDLGIGWRLRLIGSRGVRHARIWTHGSVRTSRCVLVSRRVAGSRRVRAVRRIRLATTIHLSAATVV